MMTITTIGIDPGKSGAVVVLRDGKNIIQALPTPTISSGKGSKRLYDLPGMLALLEEVEPTLVMLERQQARPAQGVVSVFSTGEGFGIWEGLLAALRYPFETPTPGNWMRSMLAGTAGEGKARSIQAAGRLLPSLNLMKTTRCRKPHDGLADAGLLALYGWRRSQA